MINTLKLYNQLNSFKQEQFTGKVTLQSTQREWKLYIGMGTLIWSNGGYHPNRSLHRYLGKFYPQKDEIATREGADGAHRLNGLSNFNMKDSEEFECPNYHLLTVLLDRNLINLEQINLILENHILDNLFDIFQHNNTETINFNCEPTSNSAFLTYGLKMSLFNLDIEKSLEKVQNNWSQWMQSGLTSWSPNLAPTLKNLEQLQQEVSPTVYQNFVKFMDGKQTLRDLAVKMNKDVLKLTCSLVPYIHKGYCELQEISDLVIANSSNSIPRNLSSTLQSKTFQASSQETQPLIVCIDDSPQIGIIMQGIIAKTNYRFLYVQDALQAVAKVVSTNPDLIFLDIGMPIINGYEICSQLRRVSKLKDTPIIMLTGNDGIIDRMRAKVVGSSDFLGKPIEVDKIISIIDKFLNHKTMLITSES